MSHPPIKEKTQKECSNPLEKKYPISKRETKDNHLEKTNRKTLSEIRSNLKEKKNVHIMKTDIMENSKICSSFGRIV